LTWIKDSSVSDVLLVYGWMDFVTSLFPFLYISDISLSAEDETELGSRPVSGEASSLTISGEVKLLSNLWP